MERGTVLFVSHDSAAVLSLCRKALWLEHGRIAGIGEAKTVCDGYLHDAYAVTQNKIGAEPPVVLPAPESNVIQLRPSMIPASKGEQGLQHAKNVSGPEDRQARIEKILFNDAVGRTVHTVSKRERVSLRIWCRTFIWLRSPIVGFLVRDRFGQSLFGANTCLAGQGISDAVAPGSSFVAVLEFVMPVLHPGDYAMSVALADGTQQQHVQHHWIHDALAFTSAPAEPCFGLFAVELVHAGLRRTSTQDARDERANDSVAL